MGDFEFLEIDEEKIKINTINLLKTSVSVINKALVNNGIVTEEELKEMFLEELKNNESNESD